MSQKSPCIRVCMMDPESGLCAGCFRTLEEIGLWSQFTMEQKESILSELELRRREKTDLNGNDLLG
ncbi:MAG: DUF1289 domain-containing protein [Leptospira sp.]|nr:DUF1289 domain-containing protein [Leptospira sp.]